MYLNKNQVNLDLNPTSQSLQTKRPVERILCKKNHVKF